MKRFFQLLPFLLAILALSLFFSSGLFHLTKFETTDEHFWKYERIPAYWHALAEGRWKKTLINDKPGVSVALVSGSGLLFSDPESHRIRNPELTLDNTFTLYDATKTEEINRALRLPILLFNTLLLVVIFFLARRAFSSDWLAAFLIVILSGIPLLIGLSQILNPDALLWSTSFAAFLSWLVFLETRQWRYIALTALFTVLALLSKYTGNFLWPLFLTLGITFPLFRDTLTAHPEALKHYCKDFLRGYLLVTILTLFLFSLLLPAVFVKPILLWRGTFGFLYAAHLLVPLVALLTLIALDLYFFQTRILQKLFRFTTSRIFAVMTRILIIIPALFFASLLLLGNTLEPHFTTAKASGELAFPLLASWPSILAILIKILTEALAFTFSIPPLLWTLLFFWYLRLLFLPLSPRTTLTLLLSWFALAFFSAALFEDVLLNARYSVILFPLFALLFALALDDLSAILPKHWFPRSILPLFILVSSCFTLWHIKPFFFNYTSPLLEPSLAIHDGWGLGYFEAAEYLNALPNKDQIVVWSDRNVICPFLDGPRCLSGYRLDLSVATPDYFILSKRGAERNYIPRDRKTNTPLLEYARLPEYAQEAIWRLNIDDRPDNFVMIVPTNLP